MFYLKLWYDMSLILDWYSLVVQPTPDGDNVGGEGGGHHGQQHGVGSGAGHHGGGEAEQYQHWQ